MLMMVCVELNRHIEGYHCTVLLDNFITGTVNVCEKLMAIGENVTLKCQHEGNSTKKKMKTFHLKSLDLTTLLVLWPTYRHLFCTSKHYRHKMKEITLAISGTER